MDNYKKITLMAAARKNSELNICILEDDSKPEGLYEQQDTKDLYYFISPEDS